MNLLRLAGQLPPVGRRDRQAPVDRQRRAGQAPLVARVNRAVRQAPAGRRNRRDRQAPVDRFHRVGRAPPVARGNQEAQETPRSHLRRRWGLEAPVDRRVRESHFRRRWALVAPAAQEARRGRCLLADQTGRVRRLFRELLLGQEDRPSRGGPQALRDHDLPCRPSLPLARAPRWLREGPAAQQNRELPLGR